MVVFLVPTGGRPKCGTVIPGRDLMSPLTDTLVCCVPLNGVCGITARMDEGGEKIFTFDPREV